MVAIVALLSLPVLLLLLLLLLFLDCAGDATGYGWIYNWF